MATNHNNNNNSIDDEQEIDLDDGDIDLQVPPIDVVPIVAATLVTDHNNDGTNNGGVVPVATGVVSSSTTTTTTRPSLNVNAYFHTSNILRREQVLQLKTLGFPSGLAQELGNTRITYPLRFWVVDNSGSMQTSDGHQLRGTLEALRVVDCNRWTELQGAVEFHAELAGLLEATTVFRLLNDPGPRVGPQEFSVAETTSASSSIKEDVETAKGIISRAEPRGVTPLTQHILEIRRRIESVESTLRSNGHQAVIVLATDGLPSNQVGESPEYVKQEFIRALKSLQSLPVWVVVRLCTDNSDVVDFFNSLDAVLELPLEVIDDFMGEAKEIQRVNKWLNYALPLHRCREMGYNHRIFDLLDERVLNKDELRQFLTLLFGRTAMENAPDPAVDWSGFASVVARAVQAEGKQWNPSTKKLDYWIDLKQLDKTYGKGGFRLFGRKQR